MKNRFLVFCFAFAPGAGQMYQGYMKRGLSIMMLFGAAIALPTMIRIEQLLVIMPIVWAYAFFDTFNISRYTEEEKSKNPDNFFSYKKEMANQDCKLFYEKRHRWIAVGTITLGIAMLYYNLISPVLWQFYYAYEMQWVAQIINEVPTLFIAVAFVIIGCKMLKKSVKSVDQDEIIEYKEGKTNE